ncbi:hypothetical protein ACO0OL_003527 [Hanseniaspora opuntiae]
MDLTIPDHLPSTIKHQLLELIHEYQEELITFKGYNSKRDKLLHDYNDSITSFSSPDKKPLNLEHKPSILSFNPMVTLDSAKNTHKSSASIGSNNKIIQKMKNTYNLENNDNNSLRSFIHTTSSGKSISRQNTVSSLPLNHSIISKNGYIPTVPLYPREEPVNNEKKFLLENTSFNSILEKRFEQHGNDLSIISINSKNKEKAITWTKLHGKVNKVTNELEKLIVLHKRKTANATKKKDSAMNEISHMSKVLLWYDSDNVIDFAAALLACFNVDLIPVPVNLETYKMSEIEEIISICDIKIVLISNSCYTALETMNDKMTSSNDGDFKKFVKFDVSNIEEHQNANGNKLLKTAPWTNMKFLKTSELGTASKNKSKNVLQVPSISYIEFTRTPLGLLSGVVMRYKTLESQFMTLSTILKSRLTNKESRQGFPENIIRPLNNRKILSSVKPFRIISTMDPTRSTGLVQGLLFSIYSGNLFISCNFRSSIASRARELESLVDKYRGNLLLIDQLQLKQVVLNYLENPMVPPSKKSTGSGSTLSKNYKKIDLSCVKFCLSSCNNIDDDTSDMIVKKWLNNLGCINASKVYSPMLTLTDFGGIFVALRDELNWKSHSLNTNKETDDEIEEPHLFDDYLINNDTVFLEKDALKENEIKMVSVEEGLSFPEKYIKLSSFGQPLPEITTCIVSPDYKVLCPEKVIGEIWIHSSSLVNEFYQMTKINEFVFNAKLDYNMMHDLISSNSSHGAIQLHQITEANHQLKIDNFLRTKLIGFSFKGKIYVFSSIDDVVLQNKLYRLPNGKHTSDISKVNNTGSETTVAMTQATSINSDGVPTNLKTLNNKNHTLAQTLSNDLQSLSSKKSVATSIPGLSLKQSVNIQDRVLETHYLQHISQTLISMSDNISEVSCFELSAPQSEHLLVMVFESPLVKKGTKTSAKTDKLLVPLVDNMFKLLWKFHSVQPFLIIAVPDGSLPRRYCSLEISNSFVERQFLNGELNVKYFKFQVDNVLIDYIPELQFKEYLEPKNPNEIRHSIFNSQISSFKNLSLKEAILKEVTNNGMDPIDENDLCLFEQDMVKEELDGKYIDTRNNRDLSNENILSILEYRIKKTPNELAFADGFANSTKKSNTNNYHKAVTWKYLSNMIGSLMKKINESKTPMKNGDAVIIMCDNSVEYTAIVLTCMYFGFKIIPLLSLSSKNQSVESSCDYLISVVRAFNVKRIFVDFKNHTLLEDTNTLTGKYLKKSKLRHRLCKLTLFSKNKIKSSLSIEIMKPIIKQKANFRSSKSMSEFVFLHENDTLWNMTTTMDSKQIIELCFTYKDVYKLNYSTRNLSIIKHTSPLGFMKSCFLGIVAGSSTTLYSLNDIKNDSKDFFQDLLHLNMRELLLTRDLFAFILIKTYDKGIKKIFTNIPNVVIPFMGKINNNDMERLVNKYGVESGLVSGKLSFIYENKFNPMISCTTILKREPIVLNIEMESLRNGIIRDTTEKSQGSLKLYDSGIIPHGHLKIINPETLLPTYLTEMGEIVVSSEYLNAKGYGLIKPKQGKLSTDEFFDEQLGIQIEGKSYIRTGDLGFLKPYKLDNNTQENVLFVLGKIEESIETETGLFFVNDVEESITKVNRDLIGKSMCMRLEDKYTIALVQLKNSGGKQMVYNYGNLAPIIATNLLMKHKLLINMIAFVDYIDTKNRHVTLSKFVSSNKDYIYGIYV